MLGEIPDVKATTNCFKPFVTNEYILYTDTIFRFSKMLNIVISVFPWINAATFIEKPSHRFLINSVFGSDFLSIT